MSNNLLYKELLVSFHKKERVKTSAEYLRAAFYD